MPALLSSKVRALRRSLARKQQLVFGEDQIRLIARHMPRDLESLRTKCLLTPPQIEAYGQQLLAITGAHERDQDKFEDCFREMQAFATGGRYAVELLNKVHGRILAHFGMEDEKYDVFSAAGVYEDPETGRLTRRYNGGGGEEQLT
jgi:hypothetical protein